MSAAGVVVVGTLGDAHSDEALRFAAREASLRGSELRVVIAYVGPIDPDVDDFETPESQLRDRAARLASQALCRALAVRPDQLPPHRIISGDLELLALLIDNAQDAELIVVGQRSRHFVQRFLRGSSSSAALTRRTRLPVTVVPEPR